MSHCRGSPCLVTLVPVCGTPVLTGIPHASGGTKRPEQSRSCTSTCRTLGTVAHRSLSLDLDDMRLRYNAYHGSTGFPPGSTSAGQPIQHEQAVQGGTRLRKTELRLKDKLSFQQHEQGLGALRSNWITHMTPRIPGVVRQAQAPIKKAALGDEGSGEEDEEEEETEVRTVASLLSRIRRRGRGA